MTPLQHRDQAVYRAANESPQAAISWQFHFVMTDADKLAFDGWLVRIGHKLAYQAGTCESRWQSFCKEMPQLNN